MELTRTGDNAVGRGRILRFVALLAAAAALIALGVHEWLQPEEDSDTELVLFGLGLGTLLLLVLSGSVKKIKIADSEVELVPLRPPEPVEPVTKTLHEEEVVRRESELKEFLREHNDRQIPGEDAPEYDLLQHSTTMDLLVRPSAYPETPMYMLDNNFRIVDWNEAFTLAFDKTMEGRIGESVLEWTYFLDNFREVLDHGTKVFGNADELPRIDVEEVRYTSLRYGPFSATKRAYQIPDDDGRCLAWLLTLDLQFPTHEAGEVFRHDLARHLSLEQLWSEYAISYDAVLNSTEIYPKLLATMIGDMGSLEPIPNDAKVLDLGAGTGNLTLKLMSGQSQRLVVALEKNRAMLEHLRSRCRQFLRDDEDGPGILVRRQDVTRLYGLRDNYFDVVILNNVLYAIDDAESCLRSVHRVLKPGGEVRISGPHRGSSPDRLFAQIRDELVRRGKFEQLKTDFDYVYQLNKFRLQHLLYRWDIEQMTELVKMDGLFDVETVDGSVYGGQSVMITARKKAT